jgi:hypothetical protein
VPSGAGWRDLPLTPLTLSLIVTVQSCAKHARDLAALGELAGLPSHAWIDIARRFYYDLPLACLPKGFVRNEDTFRFILDFQVTDEMLGTPFDQLGTTFTIRKWVVATETP